MRLDHLLSKEYMSLVCGLRKRNGVPTYSRPQTKQTIEEPIAQLERMVEDLCVDGYRPRLARGDMLSSCAAPAMGVSVSLSIKSNDMDCTVQL